ncbi:CHAT domain-containing protein [Streptomyces sp. NPDC051771]|uniref:CHAT domain-containing protein n=1 Tax=Streptomyces sp. NPDC051771 TaxID=3154847 RepID=UPI003446964D
MFGWALIGLWAAQRGEVFSDRATFPTDAARDRVLELGSLPSRELQNALGPLEPDARMRLVADVVHVAGEAGRAWRDRTLVTAMGEVLAAVALGVGLAGADALADALRRESHVLLGIAADLAGDADEAVRQFSHATRGAAADTSVLADVLGRVGLLMSPPSEEDPEELLARVATALRPYLADGGDALLRAARTRTSARRTAAGVWVPGGEEEAAEEIGRWLAEHSDEDAGELRSACAEGLYAAAHGDPETAASRARALDAAFGARLEEDSFLWRLVRVYEYGNRLPELLAVLEPWHARRPEDHAVAVRLAWAYHRTGDPASAARVLLPLVEEPPASEDERLVRLLTVFLHESGSPDAARWDAHLARLTGGEGISAMLPSMARPEPEPVPPPVRFEDGTLTIDAGALGGMPSEVVRAHIAAALLPGGSDREAGLDGLAARSPGLAERVRALLAAPQEREPRPAPPPSEADELVGRGEAHFQRRELDDAAACYRAALGLDPDHAAALLWLGDVYFVRRQVHAARAYFEESIAAGETPMAWRFLGDVLRDSPDTAEEARACYERALLLDPRYGGARQALDDLPAPRAGRRPEPPAATEPPEAKPGAKAASMLRGARRWLRGGRGRPVSPSPDPGARGSAEPGVDWAAFDSLSTAGVKHRAPHVLEAKLRFDEPSIAALLDALADDTAMAAWRDRWLPDHFGTAYTTLQALAWQWNAKAGDTRRSLLIAERLVELALGLPGQWLDGAPRFLGRALLVSGALGTQAYYLKDLGRYAEALAVLRESESWLTVDREERERTGRPLTGLSGERYDANPRVSTYQALAEAADLCGETEAAAEYRRLAEAWSEGTPPSDHERVHTLCRKAFAAMEAGRPDLCFAFLDQAMPLAVREAAWSPVEQTLALVHHSRAACLNALGLDRTALRHLAQARAHNAGNSDRLAMDWMVTAEILRGRPDLGAPLEACERVLQLSGVPAEGPGPLVWRPRHSDGEPVRIENAQRAWQVVTPMARAAWAAGERRTAVDVLELGVELADVVRAAQPRPEQRRSLQTERAEVYERLVRYRLDGTGGETDDTGAAFLATERLRSRTLLESLSTADLRPPDGVPAELLAREAALLQERAGLERAARPDWPRLRAVQEELGVLWSAIGRHSRSGEEYADVRSGAAITARAALAQLRGEQVVVASYTRLDDGRLALFTLDPRSGLSVAPLDTDGDRVLRFVEDNLGSGGRVREMAEDMPDLFQRILSPLVDPLADRLGPEDTLLICPTGPLHHVPFHALAPGGGPILLERNPVAYLPSVSLLRTLAHRGVPAGRGAVVVGDPGGDLPYAREEASVLAARLGGRPLLGPEATRERVLADVAGAGVLHAACHASFRDDDPLGSGLVLADGVLTGHDILRQDWHDVRLAVLSACETGLGGVGRTDDMLGLSRSLLFAGVRSLVMTLWRVPDRSTARIMDDFHELALTGESPARALRTAMLAARSRPDSARLDRWAAFCLLGEWRPEKGTDRLPAPNERNRA